VLKFTQPGSCEEPLLADGRHPSGPDHRSRRTRRGCLWVGCEQLTLMVSNEYKTSHSVHKRVCHSMTEHDVDRSTAKKSLGSNHCRAAIAHSAFDVSDAPWITRKSPATGKADGLKAVDHKETTATAWGSTPRGVCLDALYCVFVQYFVIADPEPRMLTTASRDHERARTECEKRPVTQCADTDANTDRALIAWQAVSGDRGRPALCRESGCETGAAFL